jgi:hypothetical protein
MLAAVALAACDPVARRIDIDAPGLDGRDAVPVSITDTTGTVVSAGFVASGNPDGVANLPGDPATLLITWLGGMCDARFDVLIEPRGGGLVVQHLTTRRGGGCLLAGIGRTLQLGFSVPVPADSVELVLQAREEPVQGG